jgi:hypothetical protein
MLNPYVAVFVQLVVVLSSLTMLVVAPHVLLQSLLLF